ncbi:MAG: lactonase family protein [Bacteroidota bacterium]
MKKTTIFLIAVLVLGIMIPALAQQSGDKDILYVGTYSQRGSKGIYVFEFDRNAIQLDLVQTVPGKESPSFLAVHPNGEYLYAVYREGMTEDTRNGTVAAFDIGSSGKLTLLNERSSEGVGPCHVSVDPEGEYVYVSNYSDGSLSVYPVHQNGKLAEASDVIVHEGSGPNSDRQEGPHMHSMIPARNGRYVYASDLGTDVITAYRLNREEGTLSATGNQRTKAKPGSGPRHFDIHPSGNFAYSAEELTSTIAAYSVESSNGALNFIERKSLIPEDFTENNTAADIQVSPDGRFVYVSNRGHSSLAIFSTDRQSGEMALEGHADVHGERPRNFLMDRKGEFVFVANRNSDDVVVFRRNQETGELKFTGEKVTVPAAVCVKQLRLD